MLSPKRETAALSPLIAQKPISQSVSSSVHSSMFSGPTSSIDASSGVQSSDESDSNPCLFPLPGVSGSSAVRYGSPPDYGDVRIYNNMIYLFKGSKQSI